VYFTREILLEMRRNVLRDYPVEPATIDKTIRQMVAAFEEGLVEDYEDLIPRMNNHPKDRHVLAAAVKADVDIIVTDNTKDFPESSRAEYEIELQTPETFLIGFVERSPEEMREMMQRWSGYLDHPPMSESGILDILSRSVPRFAEAMRGALEVEDWDQPR
jgi:predicted nucleic acid-binding protein